MLDKNFISLSRHLTSDPHLFVMRKLFLHWQASSFVLCFFPPHRFWGDDTLSVGRSHTISEWHHANIYRFFFRKVASMFVTLSPNCFPILRTLLGLLTSTSMEKVSSTAPSFYIVPEILGSKSISTGNFLRASIVPAKLDRPIGVCLETSLTSSVSLLVASFTTPLTHY